MDGMLGSCDPYVVLRFGGQVPARAPPTQHAAPCPEHPGCGLGAEGDGWRAGSRSTRRASRRARLPRSGTKSTALYQPPPSHSHVFFRVFFFTVSLDMGRDFNPDVEHIVLS
eukprot:2261095-Rhodomonas_salina.1